MIKYLFLFGMLIVSCVDTDNHGNNKNVETQRTVSIQKANTPTLAGHNKDRNLYYEFILNLEKALWSSDLFVKTDYHGRGWELIDKHGKYIIRSEDNFTASRDTSISYALTIITIDNHQTNKNGVDREISIPFHLSDGRPTTIDLTFTYNKLKITDGIAYSETIHNFPFNYGIIVDYRRCFNHEKTFTWRKDSIIQSDLDCGYPNFSRDETLWNRKKYCK